jgi:outer membrane immunogenic protein
MKEGLVMRKLLAAAGGLSAMLTLPMAAGAADLPVVPPAPAPVHAYFNWTGFYLGGNFGLTQAHDAWTDSILLTNFSTGTNNARFILGGQAGFNYQVGPLVVGVEGDVDWIANNNNNGANVITPIGTLVVVNNDTWIATAAARFGFAVDRALFYGKAGGGWVGNNGFLVTNPGTGASFSGFGSNTASGWLAGAGVEYAVTNGWTMKLEYNYLGLSARTFAVPPTAPLLAGDTFAIGTHNVQMVKLGFNYLLNWGNSPIIARY